MVLVIFGLDAVNAIATRLVPDLIHVMLTPASVTAILESKA